MKLVVVIPAYNEGRAILEVIKKIPKNLVSKTDILVVDDGSRDNTREVTEKAGAKVISFVSNRGLVEVFNAGKKWALEHKADIIVNIDGDGQHNPLEIERLIKPILDKKADVVVGSRFLTKNVHASRTKYFGNILFSRLISILIKQRITDAQSGFRAYTREVAEAIDVRKGYTYTQQMLVQVAYHRFKIMEIPITVSKRKHGKSRLIKSPLSFAYNAGSLIISIFAVYYPLKFFGFFGSLLIVFGAVFGLTFRRYDVLSSLIIATGIQFILFGILFEIIKKEHK
jgi:glycosyltransferase involved in cell wall biosynthesis